MEWLALVLSAATAVLSTATVLLVWRLDSRGERKRWLRDARLSAALGLKSEISKVRDQHSPGGTRHRAPGFRGESGFAGVNTAMAEIDLLCGDPIRQDVSLLRVQLREFLRAARDESPDWREKRDAVDSTVTSVMSKIGDELR